MYVTMAACKGIGWLVCDQGFRHFELEGWQVSTAGYQRAAIMPVQVASLSLVLLGRSKSKEVLWLQS